MPSTQAILPCRLLIDPPGDGAWNMAVDEALLLSVAGGGSCVLRFYRWSRPTLSLGYFQPHAARQIHAASRDCPLVRRQTGGGAIMHDQELTYSLSLPLAHPLAGDAVRLYRQVHEGLVAVLAGWKIQAQIASTAAPTPRGEEPFLCFERRATGDLLLGSAKIGGSAQRRLRGAILQHGSLLLARSAAAPELDGIQELSGRRLDPGELAGLCGAELAARLGVELAPGALAAGESEAAGELIAAKYANRDWNQRR